MKNEPFNPSVMSSGPPPGLVFRLAEIRDRQAMADLMAERRPDEAVSTLIARADREIALNATDPKYRVFVAQLDGRVVGLCRYFHSESVAKEKLRFPAPHGWYCMGIVVDRKMRRRGIARFLFEHRLRSM